MLGCREYLTFNMNFQNVVASVAFSCYQSHNTSLYWTFMNQSYLFASGLRAVKIITKFWELKKPRPRRISKRPTENWPSNFTQTKTTHRVPQKHLKVKQHTFLRTLTFKMFNLYRTGFELLCFLLVFCTCLSAIGNAYAVLSNAEKRRHYDQYGEERTQPGRHRHHQEFEADISPEDLFNMFFGGGFPTSNNYNHF